MINPMPAILVIAMFALIPIVRRKSK